MTETLPDTAPADPPTTGPRTPTGARVWDALSPQPQTTVEIATATGVGRSTTGKALARWARDNLIVRQAGDEQHPAHTWSLPNTPSQPDSLRAEPQATTPTTECVNGVLHEAHDPSSTSANPGPSMHTSAQPGRLKPGALHELIEDYLRHHPGEEVGPSQLGKALNRSSGAVNNALEKIAAQGVAVKTQDAPKRFTVAEH